MSGIDWLDVKTTLEDSVRMLLPAPANAPDYEPRWQYGSDGNAFAEIATGWKTFLRVVSIGEISVANRYYTPEGSPDELHEQVASMERMIIEFRCEADFHDQDAARWAVKVCDCVRKGLRLNQLKQKLYASNLAVWEVMDTIDVSFEHQDRWINAYSFEVAFGIGSCFELDPSGPGVDWFDRVILSSCVLKQGDDPNNPPDYPWNFTDRQIGPVIQP